MKLHVLLLAVALATAGTAFAQSYGPSGAAGGSGSPAAAGTTEKAPAKAHQKKGSTKAKKGHAHHHAKAQHEQHHEKHANARADRHTRAMGAGAAGPVTDLHAAARQDRIGDAYENWRRLQARR